MEEEESQHANMNEGMSSSGPEMEHGTEKGSTEGAPSAEPVTKSSRSGGRRAALKIIRQNVESVSKDLATFRKTHEASSKRLEKQVSSLRNDLEALKSYLAKESAKARNKQDASFERLLAKFNATKAANSAKAAKASKALSSKKKDLKLKLKRKK